MRGEREREREREREMENFPSFFFAREISPFYILTAIVTKLKN
jgi:hypothetical protein